MSAKNSALVEDYSSSSLSTHEVESLYGEHHGWLTSWLRKRLGCPQNAADLAQDTFLRLLLKPDTGDIRHARAYLGKIAQGLVIDQSRRRRLERIYLEHISQLPEKHMPSAEEQVTVVDALTRIDLLLDGMKSRMRQVFLMSRLDGYTYPEIAEKLDVSLSTVEKDIAMALRHCYQVRYEA